MPISTGTGATDKHLLPRKVDFNVYRGDSFNPTVKFFNQNGQGVNLSSFTPGCTIKNSSGATVLTPTVILNAGGVNGRAEIVINDTSVLPLGTYTYQFSLTDTSGKKRTYFAGDLTISEAAD